MDIRKVKKLIELLDESGIAEIEITEGEESVRISRHSPYAAPPMQMSMAPQQVMATAPAAMAS
ncbi:MAG: acetyl-CoA carboxylase biotin carboxyl carrier protein, partial [Gammaproteobacteria bacterium]|nr:acetyl-CoA carboxylase biotin carboxyl carrier protein [Gammaproteobacteria bacterium]